MRKLSRRLDVARSHPDCMRIHSKETSQVVLTRIVTWHFVLPTTPLSARQATPSPDTDGART